MTTLHDFTATAIAHRPRGCRTTRRRREVDLASYAGSVVLVVNTASKCGFTPQYRGLQELHERYADRGFAVLGFPCNQFARQEPGSADEIADFCETDFGVTFPLFAKVDVNGADAHPLYAWLRGQRGGRLGSAIKWNFTKFLLARDGTVLDRYSPRTRPEELADPIEQALAAD